MKQFRYLLPQACRNSWGSIQAEAGPTPCATPPPRPVCSLINVHVTQLLQVVPFTSIDHDPLWHEVVICGIHCEEQFPEGSEYVI